MSGLPIKAAVVAITSRISCFCWCGEAFGVRQLAATFRCPHFPAKYESCSS